jgi:hypothetical protein
MHPPPVRLHLLDPRLEPRATVERPHPRAAIGQAIALEPDEHHVGVLTVVENRLLPGAIEADEMRVVRDRGFQLKELRESDD